jgi:N-acetylglucosaminyl-diphospho-decaprenol L-rhamnosyltransferase
VTNVVGLTSVVIVACDSGTLLGECVASVLDSSAPLEIIVSDNASSDGSIEALESRWVGDARLRVLRNGANLGFAAGCNRAAAYARGDMLMFLNPDCRIEVDALERLRTHADARTGVLGAVIVGLDGKAEPASCRRDPLLRRALMTATSLARFESRWPALRGTNLSENDSAEAIEEVECVSGALMLLPRTAFDRIGGFDESYFLHFEDMDLCRRLRDVGLRVACARDVRVTHVKGTSSRSRPFFVAFHKHRGMWRWFVRFDPAARNPLTRMLVCFGIWMHYAAMVPLYGWRWLKARV